MQRAAIWIDHQKAFILEYGPTEATYRTFQPEDLNPESKDFQRKFYHRLALEIKTPLELVVFGPGMAKEEFRNHCEDHHPHLAKAILDVLPMKDHPTRPQILKASNDFYRKHQNWAGIN